MKAGAGTRKPKATPRPRLKPISLHPVKLEDALRAALKTPAPDTKSPPQKKRAM
jgi:hypothetical protein